jgi:hypothetical protein
LTSKLKKKLVFNKSLNQLSGKLESMGNKLTSVSIILMI